MLSKLTKLTIFRSILEYTELQDEMTVPLGPTNTFVLVQKKDPHKTSEFFVPKPQFDLSSQNMTSFHIRLNYNEDMQLNCNCENLVNVYSDSCEGHYKEQNYMVEKSNNNESEISYQWYQSKEVFKGFKFLR